MALQTVTVHPASTGVSCPHCGSSVGVDRITQSNRNETKGCCPKCRKWFVIELPVVRKKLVYLDQSLLSEFYSFADSPDDGQIEQCILRKLQQLKDRQKICIVVSDIHSAETAAFPQEYADQRDKLWQFQNTLADGRISGNWSDVFIAQQHRALAAPEAPEYFPSEDIGLDNPHRWRIGVKILPTNAWRGRLHRTIPKSSNFNEQVSLILTRQVKALGRAPKAHDAIDYIRTLWRQNIEEGIAAERKWRQFIRSGDLIVERIIADKTFALPDIPDSPFKGIVRAAINGLDEEPAFELWLSQLKTEAACAALRLRIALEAELLWSRAQGYGLSQKKFSENYGSSRQNDIDHVAAFVPYVDVLTIDQDMQNLCGREMSKEEFGKFPCRLISKKNYREFDAWLDSLLFEDRT